MKSTITITTEVELDITAAAGWFAGLDDEKQADFFIKVAEVSKAWDPLWASQYYLVGRHLKTCKCSTYEARELIEILNHGLKATEA